MLGNLFNSPTQLLVLVLVVVLLFGATRLPNAARQVGRSMRIFKSEMKEMKTDGDEEAPGRADTSREADRDVPGRSAPLEGRVVREDHAPRTTSEPGTTPDGLRRDA